MKKFCHIMLKLMGYKIDTVNIAPEAKKCVLVFAPHTSLSDFLIGWMALKDMGVKTAFVMKKEHIIINQELRQQFSGAGQFALPQECEGGVSPHINTLRARRRPAAAPPPSLENAAPAGYILLSYK